MRPHHVVLAAGLVAAVLYGGVVTDSTEEGVNGAPRPDQLVSPAGTGEYVWPYTSRSRSVAGRTLALNVVVHGEPSRVRRILVDRSDANWSAADPNGTAEVSPWRPAHGAVRYTYVGPKRNVAGRWVDSDYQLHVGEYFGRRTHVRAYAGRSGDWTALQAHTEYWDWFRLRHTVTGVEPAAHFVERDLHDEPFVVDISRTTHGREGGESGGEWTVVDLVPAALLAAATVQLTGRRPPAPDGLLPVALAGIVLGVRAWGLAAEAMFPGVTPKLFAAIGYPVLAVGPLALVAGLGRGRPAARIALLAALGLGIGIALDLSIVGVGRVPVHIVAHRLALLAALGMFAVGVGRADRHTAWIALVAWGGALAAPLVGVV